MKHVTAIRLFGAGGGLFLLAVLVSLVVLPRPEGGDKDMEALLPPDEGGAGALAPPPCQEKQTYALHTTYEIADKGVLDHVVPPKTSYRLRETRVPVASGRDQQLFEVRYEVVSAEGLAEDERRALEAATALPLWVLTSKGNQVEAIYTARGTATHRFNALRPLLFLFQYRSDLLQAASDGSTPREAAEADYAGPVVVRYESTNGRLGKQRLRFRSDVLPQNLPKFVESRFDYEFDDGGVRRISFQEHQQFEAMLGVNLAVHASGSSAREHRLPLSEPLVATCMNTPPAEFLNNVDAVPFGFELEVDPQEEERRRRASVNGRSFDEILADVSSSEDDGERFKQLNSLVTYLELHPEEIGRLGKLLKQGTAWDQSFAELTSVMSAVRHPKQVEAVVSLMDHFRANGGKIILEEILRSQQIASHISDEIVPYIWGLSEDSTLVRDTRQMALLAVGSGLATTHDTSLKDEYMARLIDLLNRTEGDTERQREVIAALGNAGGVASAQHLIAIIHSNGPLALQAIEALRWIDSPEAERELADQVRQTGDLERHDRALFALSFRELSKTTAEVLLKTHKNLPDHETERKEAILQLLSNQRAGLEEY